MAGPSDQWSVWLDKHRAGLVLFARQWVWSHADAEDIVQEAFVRFWRSRQRAADPAAYLFACVKHCILDWQRAGNGSPGGKRGSSPEAEPFFTGPLEQRNAAPPSTPPYATCRKTSERCS